MKIFSTLKARVLAAYVLLVLAALSAVGLSLYRLLERQAAEELRSSMSAQARLIAGSLDAARLKRGDSRYAYAAARSVAALTPCRVTIVSSAGAVLADSALEYGAALALENHLDRPEIKEAALQSPPVVSRLSATLKDEELYLAVPVASPSGPAGFVRLAMPAAASRAALASLRRTVFLSIAVSALFALSAGWLMLWLAGGQFSAIITGSKHFASGDFDHRIPEGSSGELKKLSETLNYMAGEISARMRDAELRRLELEEAFRDMPEALLIADGAGVITRMNPRARELMGVSGFEAEGMRLSGMPAGPELSSAALKALSSGRPVNAEIEPASAPGTVLAVSASPIIEAGAVRGCVLVARDITGPKRLENMRRDFVANVSHELKTPLTAIKGSAETLLSGALDDREHGPGFARTIFDQASRLDALVNDLLRLSYAESGRAALDRSEVDIKALVDEAALTVAVISRRGLTFRNEVPDGMKVSADKYKISQVLINLLDNAAKYNSDGGSITVSAAASAGRVKVTVADTGPGIAPEHLPRIFERFYRVDKARSRELGGTGLGLSIVKHLVELHGGSVGVDSAPGKGSCFWFSLPL